MRLSKPAHAVLLFCLLPVAWVACIVEDPADPKKKPDGSGSTSTAGAGGAGGGVGVGGATATASESATSTGTEMPTCTPLFTGTCGTCLVNKCCAEGAACDNACVNCLLTDPSKPACNTDAVNDLYDCLSAHCDSQCFGGGTTSSTTASSSASSANSSSSSGGGCTMCGGGCVDFDTDPMNCGGCDHSCGGAACQNGFCPASVFADGQTNPHELTLDATSVYWTTGDPNGFDAAVMKADIAGGLPVTLTTEGSHGVGIVVDANFVYWLTSLADVGKVPLNGGVAEVVYGGNGVVTSLAQDASKLYWTELNDGFSSGRIWSVSKDGTNHVSVLDQLTSPYGLSRAGTKLYWADRGTGQIGKVAVGGGVGGAVASGYLDPTDTASDGTNVYFTDAQAGKVVKVPVGGGAKTTLATGGDPWHITFDAEYVYWVDSTTVNKVPIAGGAKIVLAAQQDEPWDLAVNDTHVYWTNNTGNNVMRVAK